MDTNTNTNSNSTAIATIDCTTLANSQNGIEQLVRIWLVSRQLKTNKARVSYYNSLKPFREFLNEKGITDLSVLNHSHSLGFYYWLDSRTYTRGNAEHKLSIAAKRMYFSVAKSFCQFLCLREVIARDVFTGMKNFERDSDTHAKDPLEKNEAENLFDEVNAKAKTATQKRNRAMLAIMLTCGTRCVELCRANVGDIRQKKGKWFLYVLGKGRSSKSERVQIVPEVKTLIDDYLKTRGKVSDSEPLFISQRKSSRQYNAAVATEDSWRLSPESVSRIVKQHLRAAGIDNPRKTAHSLRHFCATSLIDNQVPIREVKTVLRHKSEVVTEIYIKENQRDNLTCENIVAAYIGLGERIKAGDFN